MDDQFPMGVGDGVADGEEQRQPRLDVEMMFIAPGEQRRTFNVLHDEVRLSRRSGSPIQKASDAWMFELGENLTLAAETRSRFGSRRRAGDQLDSDAFAVFAVGAIGKIDDAHASAADLVEDGVGADLCGSFFGCVGP